MKRLLILLILLFALPAYAQQCSEETPCPELARLSPAMMGSVPVATGDSCTGSLLLSAHFENDDDITVGGGCSAMGDSTFTRAAGATYTNTANEFQDGSYGLECSGATGARATLDITTADIDHAGRADFYMRIGTWSDWKSVFGLYYDSTNYLALILADSDDLRFTFRSTTNNNYLQTVALGIVVNTWYHVLLQWRINTGDANPELSITIDGGAPITFNDANMTGCETTPNKLELGSYVSTTDSFTGQIDNLKIYNTWSD